MTKQITLEEALLTALGASIVSIVVSSALSLALSLAKHVTSYQGNVGGIVHGTMDGRDWEFTETPKEKLQRLIKETGNQELIEAFNQLEDN